MWIRRAIEGRAEKSLDSHPIAPLAPPQSIAVEPILSKVSLNIYGKNPMHGQSRRSNPGELAV